VKVFDSAKNCFNFLYSVGFGELSSLTDTIKQFTAGCPVYQRQETSRDNKERDQK